MASAIAYVGMTENESTADTDVQTHALPLTDSSSHQLTAVFSSEQVKHGFYEHVFGRRRTERMW